MATVTQVLLRRVSGHQILGLTLMVDFNLPVPSQTLQQSLQESS